MTDQQPNHDTPPAGLGDAGRCPRHRGIAARVDPADPTAMTGAALVDAIVASEKALSLLAGTQMRLLTALAVPFVAGDPMRLAAVLARKNCITGDDDPDQVAHYVPAAAASLAVRGGRRRTADPLPHRRHPGRRSRHHDRCPRTHPERAANKDRWTGPKPG